MLPIISGRFLATFPHFHAVGLALVWLLLLLPGQQTTPRYPPGQWDTIIENETFTQTLSLDSGDDNTLIIGAEFHDIDDHALMLRNVSNVYIKDCIIHDINGFGILLRGTGSTKNVTIDGCKIYNTVSSGIMASQRSGDGVDHPNLVIKNNTIYNNGRNDHEHNIYVQATDTLIENNTVYNSSGNGISVRSTGIIRNNNIWASAKSCIRYYNDHAPGPSGVVLIENNLCQLSDEGFNSSPALSLRLSPVSPKSWLADKYIIRGNTVVLSTDKRYGFEVESRAFAGKRVEVQNNVFINTVNPDKALNPDFVDSATGNRISGSLLEFAEVTEKLDAFNLLSDDLAAELAAAKAVPEETVVENGCTGNWLDQIFGCVTSEKARNLLAYFFSYFSNEQPDYNSPDPEKPEN